MKKFWEVFLGILIIGLLALFGYWIATISFALLSDLEKSVLAAMLTAIAVSATAIFVKHVEHRHTVESQFREHKVEMFQSFLSELDKLSSDNTDSQEKEGDLVQFLQDWQRKLIFWGGPQVLKSYLVFRGDVGESKTVNDLGRMLLALGALILSMRKDIGLSNKGIDKKTFAANLILRHPDLFLDMLNKDPSMTLNELTELEQLQK